MARTKADQSVIKEMSKRVIEIAKEDYGMGLKELSSYLNYENQSPLTKMKNGESFLGPEKLKKFALLKNENGECPNFYYIFTGAGSRVINYENEDDIVSKKLVSALGRERAEKLASAVAD